METGVHMQPDNFGHSSPFGEIGVTFDESVILVYNELVFINTCAIFKKDI